MNEILFISETENTPELKLAKQEIVHYGYNLTNPISKHKAINYLKSTTINTVLINAYNFKLEAHSLCQEIKENFRGAVKTFVYLPQSNPNEGSKFGLANAEVEDSQSIINLVNKLPNRGNRDYLLQENIVSIYGLNGGCGCSTIAILLAYILDSQKENSLIVESSNNLSLNNYLAFDKKLPLLSRDKSNELDQAKDLDWFNGFISKNNLIPRMHHLNLFANTIEKTQYLENISPFLNQVSEEINKLADKNQLQNIAFDEVEAKLFSLSNSLKLLSKECEGDSYSLFEEIIQLGSKISKNFIFDLSSDINSSLNKQLLRLSKSLIIVFRDSYNIKKEWTLIKNYLDDTYKLEVIPVIAANHHQYYKYESLNSTDWKSLLGFVPTIYPYDPESITRFLLDGETISHKNKLYQFAKQLLNISLGKKKKANTFSVKAPPKIITRKHKTLFSFLNLRKQ